MRQDVYEVIKENEDLLKLLRMQPHWYRKLMRNPQLLEKLDTDAVFFFKKSIPDRVSKFSDGVQFASMMMNMFQAMKTPST
ncbi:YlbE-like family protein [Peribacillus sp. JNUCC 23]|uniref:YlbE-like family protein n=1 Tax=Peribacillus sp. NPDC096379 TaxID=3364393 RepID=UPI00380A7BA4